MKYVGGIYYRYFLLNFECAIGGFQYVKREGDLYMECFFAKI